MLKEVFEGFINLLEEKRCSMEKNIKLDFFGDPAFILTKK